MARPPDNIKIVEAKLIEARNNVAIYRKKTRTYLKKLWEWEDKEKKYSNKFNEMLHSAYQSRQPEDDDGFSLL